MPARDRNHIHARLAGNPGFFVVVDLIERSLAAQGVAFEAHFHENEGRHWMHFRIAPTTKDEVAVTVRTILLPQGSEIRNLRADAISGPGAEPVATALRELISRFGGDWEERDYYTAAKIALPKVRKARAGEYEPSERIKAAVEIAEAVGFDGMEDFLNLLKDRAKSAGFADVIAKYGPSIGHREAEEARVPDFG